MNMERFMHELRELLGNLNRQQRDEILNDFYEHFAFAKQEGKSEEEICRALGEPTAIAAQFLRQGATQSARQSPYAAERQPSRQSVEGSSKMEGSFSTEGVSLIHVDMHASKVIIRSHRDQNREITVTITGADSKRRYKLYSESGCVYVVEERRTQGLFPFLFFGASKEHGIVTTVSVPEGFRCSIQAETAAGDLMIEDVEGILLKARSAWGEGRLRNCRFQDIDAHISAGGLRAEHCVGGTVNMKSSAGDVIVDNLSGDAKVHSSAGNVRVMEGEGNLRVSSSAGNVHVVSRQGDVTAKTSAGNVHIKCASGTIRAKTAAGNVDVDADEIYEMEGNSMAGNVSVTANKIANATLTTSAGGVKLKTDMIKGEVKIKSMAGDAKVYLSPQAEVKIRAKTNMGKVKQEMESNENANAVLYVESSFGDVKVKRK